MTTGKKEKEREEEEERLDVRGMELELERVQTFQEVKWTLEMPGWPQPTLCSQGVGDQIERGQTRPPDGEEHTWEPKTKPNRLSQAPTGSCPFNFSYSTQPSV